MFAIMIIVISACSVSNAENTDASMGYAHKPRQDIHTQLGDSALIGNGSVAPNRRYPKQTSSDLGKWRRMRAHAT
jgi:hypothetical protein